MKQSTLVLIIVLAVVFLLILGLVLWSALSRHKPTHKHPFKSIFIDTKGTMIKYNLCSKSSKACACPRGEHPCCVSYLLEMHNFLVKLCQEEGIVISIISGTLLGHQRHGGIIPWDCDLDMMIRWKDRKKFLSLADKIGNAGYVLRHNRGKSNHHHAPDYDYAELLYSKTNENHVDIAFLTEKQVGDHMYMCDMPPHVAESLNEKSLSQYPAHIFRKEYVFPVKMSTFYGQATFIPSFPIHLLKDVYGEDVMVQAKKGNGVNLNHLMKNIEIYRFYPAKPLLTYPSIQKPNPEYPFRKVFFINMASRKDRLHHMIKQLHHRKLLSEKVVAVMPQSRKQLEALGVVDGTCQLQPTEIACYLSHVKAWDKIAQDPIETYYMVVEDFSDNQ